MFTVNDFVEFLKEMSTEIDAETTAGRVHPLLRVPSAFAPLFGKDNQGQAYAMADLYLLGILDYYLEVTVDGLAPMFEYNLPN